jgi:endo-1,4-beta-mannosidase
MAEPFILGVNYWPRRKAMYWWQDFDVDEVKQEFSVLKSIGLAVVRFFLLWDDFQPDPTTVDPQALRNLESVAEVADELDLRLDITFFTGSLALRAVHAAWI